MCKNEENKCVRKSMPNLQKKITINKKDNKINYSPPQRKVQINR